MKDEIMKRLAATLGALNSISVRGKEDIANMAGSLAVLEEIYEMLAHADICETKEKKESEGR